MRKNFKKKMASYRIHPEIWELVAEVSDRTGLSQADLVEKCIRHSIESVSKEALQDRQSQIASLRERIFGSQNSSPPEPTAPKRRQPEAKLQ
jgi:hypothetical protein